MEKIFFMSGMPRSGSHLLSDILNQNPDIHSEGYSALCRLLYGINSVILEDSCQEELSYFGRNESLFSSSILNEIVYKYYDKVEKKYIIDKNRSWMFPENVELIKNHIDKSPKFIVLERNIEDVFKSFMNLFLKNGYTPEYSENILLSLDGRPGGNPLLRPTASLICSKLYKDEKIYYIRYEHFLNNLEKTLDELYIFLEIDRYVHNFEKIIPSYRESGNILFNEMVDRKSIVTDIKYEVDISQKAKEKINHINRVLEISDKKNKTKRDFFELENFIIGNSY